MKHKGKILYLDVPTPAKAGGIFPGTPLKLIEAFVPLQSRLMSLPLHSQGSCGHAIPLRYLQITSVTGGGVQQQVLLGSMTLS